MGVDVVSPPREIQKDNKGLCEQKRDFVWSVDEAAEIISPTDMVVPSSRAAS